MDMSEARFPDSIDDDKRSALLNDVVGFLVTMGFAMSSSSQRAQDKVGAGIATCVQITGDLACGTHHLIADRNYYAAASLGRQILESTQLIQYFAMRPERAEFWLTATDDQMKNAVDFKTKPLRQATASSNTVYGRHCALGGHPRSVARILLPGSPFRLPGETIDLSPAGFDITTTIRGLLLADTLQHLYDATIATIKVLDDNAFRELGDWTERSEQFVGDLVRSLIGWRKIDPLAAVGFAE